MSTPHGTSGWRFTPSAAGSAAVRARREARLRLIEERVSRRQFLGVSASAAGLLLGSGSDATAHERTCEPQPIPHTIDLDGAGPLPPIHILLPGVVNPADADPSTITDFNGQVGYAIIDGTGTRTDLTTNTVTQNPFEVDLRFMKGTFVGADGRRCHGALALI